MQQRDADTVPQALGLFVPGTTPRPRSTESEAIICSASEQRTASYSAPFDYSIVFCLLALLFYT